ncbi:MAG TPA: transposase [Kineosporiaceae bacterium]
MARKTYSDEFRRQAVDLFESTPGATLKGIAADLGITRGALAQWVRLLGTGTTAPASPSAAGSPAPARRAAPAVGAAARRVGPRPVLGAADPRRAAGAARRGRRRTCQLRRACAVEPVADSPGRALVRIGTPGRLVRLELAA